MSVDKDRVKEQRRQWYLKNREKVLARVKAYASDNKDKLKKRRREYFLKHKDERLEYLKKWQEENKEKVVSYKRGYVRTHKTEIKEQSKRYFSNPRVKENINFHTARYRSERKGLETTLTKNEWEDCKKYFGNKCAYCGEAKFLTKDHFVPVYKNGGLKKENIVPACKNCNCQKHRLDFQEWYPNQPFYSKERHMKILSYIDGDKSNESYDTYRFQREV